MKKRKYSDKPIFSVRDGKIYLLLLIIFLLASKYVEICNTPTHLVSPVVSHPVVETVYATDKSQEVIKCELGVAEYLECQALKGDITPWQADVLLAIAKAESGVREDAININTNRTIDRGVFQINSIHKDISNKDAFDWKKNTQYAIKMMKTQGFTPWVAYKTGAYKKFL